jgi:hypothetical protein
MAKKFNRIITGLLTIAIMSMTFQSCLKDQEDVFDESAAQRLTNTLKAAQKVLVGAENGWRMYYYPDPDQSYGGYVYTLKFTEDKVTVWSEIFDGASESLYKMTRDDGPVLSFDTNNYNFHFFATPSGSTRNLYGDSGNYQAYKGDFEFMILSAAANEVILKGKRTGNIIKMYPLGADEDAEQLTIDIYNVGQSVFVSQFVGNVGGKDFTAFLDLDYRWISFYETVTDGDGKQVAGDLIAESPYAYTETGLLLYNPLTVGTATIESIEWLEAEGSISIGGTVVKGQLPEGWHPYADFIGTYTLNYQWELDPEVDGTKDLSGIEIAEDTPGKSYLVKNLSPQFDIKASYSLASGQMTILVQIVGQQDAYDVTMCAWDSNAGYITWNAAVGLSGKFADSETKDVMYWGDNGAWGSYVAESFRLYYFSGSTRVSGSASPWLFANNSTYVWGWKKMTRE